jgi:hypothetical protein
MFDVEINEPEKVYAADIPKGVPFVCNGVLYVRVSDGAEQIDIDCAGFGRAGFFIETINPRTVVTRVDRVEVKVFVGGA